VPPGQGIALHAALATAGADAHLMLVDSADHIFLGCPDIPAILAESVAFLAAQLSGGHGQESAVTAGGDGNA
jgi:hypothetical protein